LPATAAHGATRTAEKICRCELQVSQSALGGKADQLGVGSHPGLGLDEIVIILDCLDAEIEI
jgi:hypothetical protein